MMVEGMRELCGDVRFGDEFELDWVYEFDSPRFFDFRLGESAAEFVAAERWFGTAPSYPPSPFVVRLSERERLLKERSYTIKPKDATDEILNGATQAVCLQKDEDLAVPAICDHKGKEVSKSKPKLAGKASLPRVSTLMKPTASILATQNQDREGRFRNGQRFGKLLEKPILSENQASKRQKLEGGLPSKVVRMHPQSHLAHRVAKKNGLPADHSELPRLKLTVPRQPELCTAQRAQRYRPKEGMGEQNTSINTQIHKARSGQKILEAPLLSKQNDSINLSAFEVAEKDINTRLNSKKLQCQRPEPREQRRPESDATVYKFKARPLNQKIFSSKGDMGVFLTSKPQLTKPVPFNFSADKRSCQNPPTELFCKMSLTDIKQGATSNPKILRPPHMPKVAKENVSSSLHQGLIKDFCLSKNTVAGYQRNAQDPGRTLTEINSGDNLCSSFGVH